MKKKTDYLNVALLVGVGLVIVLAIFTFNSLKQDSAKCVVNPIEYGIKVYETKLNTTMACQCNFGSNKYLPLYISDNGTIPLNLNDNNDKPVDFNYSLGEIIKG